MPVSTLHPNIIIRPIQELTNVNQLVETNLQLHPYNLLFPHNTICCIHVKQLPTNS